jgi:hypothetical protein
MQQRQFRMVRQRLADFLADHVRKEYLLFKEIEGLLKPDNDRNIIREFDKIDAARRPKVKDVVALVEELESKYAPAA